MPLLEFDPLIIKDTSLITLINKRVLGTEPTLVETYRIPASKIVRVREVPLDDGSLNIPGFTEVTSPPLAGEFAVNYISGLITFNTADVGSDVTITYKGRGSIVFAEDVNKLSSPFVPFYNKLNGIVPDLPATQDFVFPSDVTVNGNLNIVGVVNKSASEVIDVTDDILLLNSGAVAPGPDMGMELERGGANPSLMWLEADDSWNFLSTTGSNLFKIYNTGGALLSAGDLTVDGDVTANNLIINATNTFQLGKYTDAQEATLVAGLLVADAGKIWYNTTSNQAKLWNGSASVIMG